MQITVERITYHVQIRGNGYPIVCIHGFSENMNTWNGIDIPRYRLVMIDLIGHGASDRPYEKKYYVLETIIRHLHEILRELKITSYALLGYSMGGRIATAYTLMYKKEVTALILESASYGEHGLRNRYVRRKQDKALAKNILKKGIPWFNTYWRKLSIFDSQKKLPEEKKAAIEKRRLGNSAHALANTLRMTGQGKLPYVGRRIKTLKMPILYICGEFDHKYCEIGRQIAIFNHNTVLKTILDAGHNTHIEQGKSFMGSVGCFLQQYVES